MKLLVLLSLSSQLIAGEPDDFSARLDIKATVGNSRINAVVNGLLRQAVDDANANKSTQSCDRKMLHNYLKDELDRNFPNITGYLYRTIPVAGLMDYSKVPYLGEIPYGRTSFNPSAKIKIDDEEFVIGLDKVDHFFSHGFLYWNLVGQDPELPAKKVNEALNLGVAQEDGPWGLKSFGVKSYADLSANYRGLFFWRDLFDGKSPMIACEDNKFVFKNEFALENYFDSSMDETINCNSYKSQEMLKAIKTFTDKNKVSCPVSSASCAKLKKKLNAEIAKKTLHPLCLGTGTSQVETPSRVTTKDLLDAAGALASGGTNLYDMLFPPSRGKVVEPGAIVK